MTQLPLVLAIPRFKTNEERVDKLVNGTALETWQTSEGVTLPSFAKFLADKDEEINDVADGILAGAQAAATASAASAVEADGYADAAAESAALASVVVGKTMTFDSVAELNAATIPDNITVVRTNGYYGPTGYGAAKYRRISGSVQEGEQTSNGGTVRWGLVAAQYHDVCQYGAVADGVTVDNDAVISMATALGYVRFAFGSCALNTMNINVPLYFDVGASIHSLTGQTVSISSRIQSPRQFILQGSGAYALGHVDGIGEDAREVHISWFGAFPQALSTGGVDQAALIQKATDSMGNGRESVIKFDVGNYWMRNGVVLTRGCHIKGDGTRRTVFKTDVDGFVFFTSGNVAGKLSDIQFEIVLSAISTRTSPFIEIKHDDWELFDINVGQTALGIVVSAGINPRIRNIRAVYGANQGAGSSMIKITAGGIVNIQGVYQTSSGTFGPEHLIDISAVSNISNIEIEDVQTLNPSIPIRIRATGGNMSGINIRDVIFNGFSGAIPTTVVHILGENGFGLSGVNINGVNSNSRPSSAIRIENTGTGVVENITIDGVTISGSTGNGIEFIKGSTGALRDITIGGAVDVSERSTPFFYSGNPTGIKISPTAIKGALPVASYDFEIGDESVASINLQRSVFAGWLMIAVGNTERAIYTFRAASSPSITAYGTPSANMNAANTVLTGSTGTDLKFTTGVTDGMLYFENRLGSSTRVNVTLMAANI